MSLENLSIEDMNNMSQEDFDKLDPSKLVELDNANTPDDPDDEDKGAENEEDNNDNPDEDNNDAGDDAGNGDDNEEEEENNANDNPDVDPNTDTPLADKSTEVPKDKPAKKAEAVEEEAAEEPDYKAYYERMTGTFKANGKDYTITDPAESIALIQKGLNYNYKMNQIKQYAPAGRLLEENGLLQDSEALGFLIELHKGNPEAIAKLIKDKGIDAYELDEEKASAYKPTPANIVPENIVQLREITQANKENADFVAVYNDVNSWDEGSQQAVIGNPAILETLTNHKRDGVYDKVMQQVQHEINVRNNKTPVMDLYLAIGKGMYANEQTNTAQAKQKAVPSTKVTKRTDPLLEAKRKAAAGNKSTSKPLSSNSMTEEEIFALSPADFAKLDVSKLAK